MEGGSHKHYIVIPIGFPWDPGGIWVLPKIGIYTPTWMVYNGKPMKTPIKMDDLGVPLFSETSNMYLHEWLDFFNEKTCIGKYTVRPMDPMRYMMYI